MADTLTLLTRDQIGILFWSSVQFNTLFCTQHSGLCAHSDLRSSTRSRISTLLCWSGGCDLSKRVLQGSLGRPGLRLPTTCS